MNRLFESEKKIYKVDYRGQMNQFDGAKDNYVEGAEVEISYSLIATDTNYTFYVDGQEVGVEWNAKKGYIIRFTMPSHDIEVYCVEKNLMKYFNMIIETERLILRKWTQDDAESLFTYAKNPNVGLIAGWPPHNDIESSRYVIDNVFNGAECYAICEKENNVAIGAVELKLNGHTDMTERDDECELGYWLGEPFWGRGYMPEAASALIKRGFEELGMTTIWCGYYDGNEKSKRVQEKLGFVYHHTCNEVPVTLLNEVRIGHTNVMTKEQWERL